MLSRKPNTNGICPVLEGGRRNFQGMRDELGCGDLGWKVHKGSSQQYQFPTKVRNGQENFFESMESLQKKEILSSDLPRDREA